MPFPILIEILGDMNGLRMNSVHKNQLSHPGEVQRRPNKITSFFLHFLLPLIALACGIAITVYLLKTSPEAKPRQRPPTATLVEVQEVVTGPQKTVIHAMGEIVPAREIELKPRVNGEVINLSDEFLPGGYFAKGQKILQIDPVDYGLVVEQLESEAEKAESDLLLEMGNQRIAEKELSLLNEEVSADEQALILRKPQLAKLQATRVSAEAQLAQARLDLRRTEISAPFNSVISTRNVNVGTRVTQTTVLANLVGSDVFWLKLTLPVEQLQWIKIPTSRDEKGSEVKIYSQGSGNGESYRSGYVIRLLASLEEQGRMAQLLVQIEDPLSRKPQNSEKPKLLLGSYVKAEVEGIGIAEGITIDRAHVHDGGKVWLMDDDGFLDIRNIEVVFRSRDQVIIRNDLVDGDRLITTPLSSPIAGTPLRLVGTAKQADGIQQSEHGQQQNQQERRVSRAE